MGTVAAIGTQMQRLSRAPVASGGLRVPDLTGETMRVVIDVAAEGDNLFQASPPQGAILSGTFATGDGLVFNRAWRNTSNDYMFLFRDDTSTITIATFITNNSAKSLYVITEDGTAEFAVSGAETAASYIRWNMGVDSAERTLFAGIANGDDIALIFADAGQS